jgi:hypothetical protein
VKGTRRIAGVAAGSWILATAVTSLVVWRAVAVLNDGASTNVLSAPQVSARLSAATATATTPSASAASSTPAPAPTSSSASPRETSETSRGTTAGTASATTPPPTSASPVAVTTPVVNTWTVTGGSVSVSCVGPTISLVYAAPQDGWRVEIEKRGPDRVEVDLQREGQGTKLEATCANGLPQDTLQSTKGRD